MENQQAVFIDFENIALWAEREFFDFELTPLIEYLQSRGPAVVKRAYGDWSRFLRYRDELMNLSIDLVQIYSVRAGKNRADIRMAIDALEIAITRSQVQTFVLVSGDSDFSPLAVKLREYGRYTLGVGPRSITHDLLVRSCDEFVYLETILGETDDEDVQIGLERETARNTLRKALHAHGQRGEFPVLASRLKQTMLQMDSAFNEANFGHSQFKTWLEENKDLIKLYVRDLQLYVTPPNYIVAGNLGLLPMEVGGEAHDTTSPPPTLDSQYRHLFTRLKMISADINTRRDVLRDIYRELNEKAGAMTTDELLDTLRERYAAQDVIRSKPMLREILQMAYRQRAFDYGKETASLYVPVWLAKGIDSEADFVRRAESDFVHAVIRSGLELDASDLACIVVNDREQTDYILSLAEDLRQRGQVMRKGKQFTLPGRDAIPFRDEAALQVVCRDIDAVELPEGGQRGVSMARSLAKTAMVQRSQDFVVSAENFLLACRMQWDAVEANETGATLQDLRWYMASFASAVAGKLSQVNRDYASARPYYLAFFHLVQEDDPLWSRMRGLINPMLSYYWANAARELDMNTASWNLGVASPTQIAAAILNHPNLDLRKHWQKITSDLAKVNPNLLQRIADQILHDRADIPDHVHIAEQIRRLLPD
ncbi:MAG: NYN domain-containing protein [Chloroflexi bacterium]|nr:NYN domain-containing protein [Chloroflexota bacterium]